MITKQDKQRQAKMDGHRHTKTWINTDRYRNIVIQTDKDTQKDTHGHSNRHTDIQDR